jgi:hypothetical protein
MTFTAWLYMTVAALLFSFKLMRLCVRNKCRQFKNRHSRLTAMKTYAFITRNGHRAKMRCHPLLTRSEWVGRARVGYINIPWNVKIKSWLLARYAPLLIGLLLPPRDVGLSPGCHCYRIWQLSLPLERCKSSPLLLPLKSCGILCFHRGGSLSLKVIIH